MSYNITSINGNFENARIHKDVVQELWDKYEGDLPEINLLEDLLERSEPNEDGYYPITRLSWCSQGSGWAYSILKDYVLTRTEGNMELFLTWEGGQDFTGLRVVDGKVTLCNINWVLVDKVNHE